MPGSLRPSDLWIAATIVAIVGMILVPPLVAFVVGRRLHVGWRFFGYGALIFFLFQMLTRVPAVTAAQTILAPQLQASAPLRWAWLAVLSLTAGLFEEVGRYVGYRWLMRHDEKTWPRAVMYGLGHGGVESMVLISGLALTQLLTILSLASGGINSLPPEQRDIATRQLGAIAAQPAWIPLLSLWERVCTLAVHVGLSVLVAQVFTRAALRYLWLAILAHAAVDLLGVGLPQALGPNDPLTLPLSFALLTLFGLAGLALTRAYRLEPGGNAPRKRRKQINSNAG